MITNNEVEIAKAVQEMYPDIDWPRFEEINRSLNWELWYGPLPEDYWTVAEPLEHYKWQGYMKAEDDLREILEPVNYDLWYDEDSGVVTDKNPEDDENNWIHDEESDSYEWVGYGWITVNAIEALTYVEVYKQVF